MALSDRSCFFTLSMLTPEVLGEDGPCWSFPPALPVARCWLLTPASCAAICLGLTVPCPERSKRRWGFGVSVLCPGVAGVQGHCCCRQGQQG